MKLTAEVLQRSEQYLNAVRERELHLRGLKIPAIENLAVMQDQFDVIDFSDNEIKKLDNFPKMTRLTTILMHNNYVARIGKMLAENVSGLKCLMLTNNRITGLSDLDNLLPLTKLEHLSLLDNPVSLRTQYRTYIIFKFPSLKTIDYRKVTQTERTDSAKFFKSKEGKAFLTTIADEKTTAASSSSSRTAAAPTVPALVLTDAQKALVRAAIEAATTREDIDVIERHLKAGSLAFLDQSTSRGSGSGAGSGGGSGSGSGSGDGSGIGSGGESGEPSAEGVQVASVSSSAAAVSRIAVVKGAEPEAVEEVARNAVPDTDMDMDD